MSQIDSNFYFMDEFQVISLYPPVKAQDPNETINTNDRNTDIMRAPPAGNFRIQEDSIKRNKKASPGNINGSTLGSEDTDDKPSSGNSKVFNNNHILLEKSLPFGIGEDSLASQWFDYKNQIDIKVTFVPFLSCKIPAAIPTPTHHRKSNSQTNFSFIA